MKYILQIILFLLVTFKVQAQDIPSIKVGDDKLGITSLDIKVEIIGNIATTTYDMLFYNPTNSVLEGELAFPLGEGQNVSRLALEVNGKLREAVVVEKEQGRVAFEAVVRRGVDPVLLEKVTGNNYKARIYPIPAKGYKRVVLAHEQELALNEDAHYFQLPLGFKKNLDYFAIEMLVFNQDITPSISKGALSNFKFNPVHSNFYAKTVKKNFTPKTSLTIKIPQGYENNKKIICDDYFYVYKRLNPENRTRVKSKEITLFWDVSLSQKERDLEKELQFLDIYFKYLEKVKVKLVTFSNEIQFEQKYNIKNGNWEDLKEVLSTSVYDGGTSYTNLFFNKNSDEILLFSDGMKNLSGFPNTFSVPVFVVNSIVRANHSELKNLCEKTKGKYINLEKNTVAEALYKIKFEAFKLLSAKSSNSVLEIYPNKEVSVGKDFSISGKGFQEKDTIRLQFGYGDEITKTETVIIKKDINNPLVKRIWAQKKLEVLQEESELNKESIITHSKLYNLVSDHTSLIVLETVWDYVQYKITPPEELLEEYNTILEKNKGKQVKVVQREKKGQEIEEVEIKSIINDGNFQGRISGTISDEDGLPMPGVSILVKGTSNGTQTDFDGNYSINASVGDVITYSSIGYHTLEADVGTSSNISFSMEENNAAIDEVVITALGIKRKVDNVGFAYQTITNAELNRDFYRGQHGSSSWRSRDNKSSTNKRGKYKGDLIVYNNINKAYYIKELLKTNSLQEAYSLYLKQREDYRDVPAYYVDVYDYFKVLGDNDYSLRILTNIAEIDFDNYELLRVLAYKLEENKNYKLASYIYKRILKLRPEDSQSYRDVALVYEAIEENEKAFNLLNDIITGTIYKANRRRQFKGVESIAKHEINKIMKKSNSIDKEELIDYNNIKATFDVRIVIDWNHNDTDIDLHVIDPNREECSYKHTKTKIGGEISADMTQGFGPEEFILKNAKKGEYYVKVKYYGDRYQKVENPTFMKVTMFKNYGKPNETKEIKVIRLTKTKDKQIVAKIEV